MKNYYGYHACPAGVKFVTTRLARLQGAGAGKGVAGASGFEARASSDHLNLESAMARRWLRSRQCEVFQEAGLSPLCFADRNAAYIPNCGTYAPPAK